MNEFKLSSHSNVFKNSTTDFNGQKFNRNNRKTFYNFYKYASNDSMNERFHFYKVQRLITIYLQN